MVQDRTIEWSTNGVVYGLSNGAIVNDIERPLTSGRITA